MQKLVLGKGLSALIPVSTESAGDQVSMIEVDEICFNPLQPRKKFEQEKIIELAESIKQHGLLQPVIVTRKDGLYHLVVGERRLRAVKELGYDRIPAVIKEYAWDEMIKVALVENLQREDLNPVEEARSYMLLIKEHNLTQEEVAKAIGRSRPYVANMVRLINLPVEIISDLEAGELSSGHARALLGLDDEKQMLAAAAKIKKSGLSVRQTENLVRQIKEENKKRKSIKKELPPLYRQAQESLSQQYQTRVFIKKSIGNKGKIEIHFGSEEELSRILDKLVEEQQWY